MIVDFHLFSKNTAIFPNLVKNYTFSTPFPDSFYYLCRQMKSNERNMAEKAKNTLLIETGNPRLLKAPVKGGTEFSLYLEYKIGYKEENGSCVRKKEGLSLRLMANPRTQAQRQKNKETIELAEDHAYLAGAVNGQVLCEVRDRTAAKIEYRRIIDAEVVANNHR